MLWKTYAPKLSVHAQLTFITDSLLSCRKEFLSLDSTLQCKGRRCEHSIIKDKATHGHRMRVERKLPCEGLSPKHAFITDNANPCAMYMSSDEAQCKGRYLEQGFIKHNVRRLATRRAQTEPSIKKPTPQPQRGLRPVDFFANDNATPCAM